MRNRIAGVLLLAACSKPLPSPSEDPQAPPANAATRDSGQEAAPARGWENLAHRLEDPASRQSATAELRQNLAADDSPPSARDAALVLAALTAAPEVDEDGQLRVVLARALGGFGDPSVAPTLVSVLQQSIERQPVAVHRAAAESIGRLRDAAGARALVTVPFRVPDTPTTTSIGEVAKAALGAIGEPAVPAVLHALAGKDAQLDRLVREHGIAPHFFVAAMAGLLGNLGRASAVEPLLAALPPKATTNKDPHSANMVRGVVANALGAIADPRAVAPLCAHALASRSPTDMFPIAEALGRIGGRQAVDCLATIITGATYRDVARDLVHELRWEAARFGIQAATPDTLSTIEKAIARASRKPRVRNEMRAWQPAIKAVKECRVDDACWRAKLSDEKAPWVVREKAALEVARANPNDPTAALAIARSVSVRDADARVTMAWLPAHMLGNGDTRCPACAEALQAQLDRDRGELDRRYQLSVLVARYTIAKLREP